MNEKQFEELKQSVRQASRIRRGEQPASRERRFEPVDVGELRRNMGMTQERFSRLIGVPTSTLRNWEQGRREPRGPALALLSAVRRDPEHVLKALAAD